MTVGGFALRLEASTLQEMARKANSSCKSNCEIRKLSIQELRRVFSESHVRVRRATVSE